MAIKEITVGTDYTSMPGGRYEKYGDHSGEDFRDRVLAPALQEFDRVVIYLDGARTYSGSFLEEAFGGLIRKRGFKYEDLRQRLQVLARAPRYDLYRRMVETDLAAAAVEVKQRAR